MTLTISIVNHSNPHLLLQCLRSLFSTTEGLRFEVWVIDNATDQRLVPEMRQEFPQVRWLFNPERLGFSANHNRMLSQAESDYLCILNDDTVINLGCIRALVDYMNSDPAAGVVGPRLLNTDGSVQVSAFREVDLLQEAIDLLILPQFLTFLKNRQVHQGAFAGVPASVDLLLGACLLFRHRALRQIGILDAAMSPLANIEDLDICHRLRLGGWKVVLFPGATLTHIRGQSVRGERMWSEYMRLRLVYHRKHFGLFSYGCARGIHILAAAWNSAMIAQRALREGQGCGPSVRRRIGNLWQAALQPLVFAKST